MKLNKEQSRVVTAPLQPVLVIASAGTGKTRVLTERIIYLLNNPEHNIGPANILAITFTNLAAEEMRARIHQRIPFSHKIPSSIGTIHSLFCEILRRDIEKVCSSRDHNFELLQEEGQKWALRSSFYKAGKDSFSRHKYKEIRTILSNWKLGNFFNYDGISNDEKVHYQHIFEEYESLLKSKNFLDFDDVLIFALKLLEENPEVRDYWINKYKAILVDECQDLNEIQWRLIKTLIPGKNANFFAVGDPNQCIYIFNGAKEDIFSEIKTLFPDLLFFELNENYRCAESIVTCANEIKQIKNLDSISMRKFNGEVLRYNFPVEALRHILEAKNFSNWAILFARHADANSIVEHLIENGIPFRISRFFVTEDPYIERLINLFRVIFFDNSKPLEYLIWSKEVNLSFNTKFEITKLENLPFGFTLMDFLFKTDMWKNLLDNPADILELQNFIDDLKKFRSLPKTNLSSLIPDLKVFLFKTDIPDKSLKKMKLFEKWLKNIQTQSTPEFSENIVLNFKGYSEFSKEEINKGDHDFVTLSTIYKTKGLEWNNVIVLNYDSLIKESENQSKDKHLAYVAATRAKDKLLIVQNK